MPSPSVLWFELHTAESDVSIVPMGSILHMPLLASRDGALREAILILAEEVL